MVLNKWSTKELESDQTAQLLGATLKEKLMYYPQQSKVYVQGITLLCSHHEVSNALLALIVCLKLILCLTRATFSTLWICLSKSPKKKPSRDP